MLIGLSTFTKATVPLLTCFSIPLKVVHHEANFGNHLKRLQPVRSFRPLPYDFNGLSEAGVSSVVLMTDVIYAF